MKHDRIEQNLHNTRSTTYLPLYTIDVLGPDNTVLDHLLLEHLVGLTCQVGLSHLRDDLLDALPLTTTQVRKDVDIPLTQRDDMNTVLTELSLPGLDLTLTRSTLSARSSSIICPLIISS